MSNNLFKGIIKLTQEQFNTLKESGTLTVGEEAITYSPNDTVYVVEDSISEQVETNTNDITQLQTNISDLETDMTYKLDKNQGAENTGKFLGVGDTGEVTPTELPNTGIKYLIGTEDSPVNLYADTEVGQIYAVSGYVWRKPNGTGGKDKFDISSLVFYFRKESDTEGVIDGLLLKSNGTNGSTGGTQIVFNSDPNNSSRVVGEIALYNTFLRLNVNGGNSAPLTPLMIYVPTTAGSAGQVLQSTGGEPEWVDLNIEPTALDMTNSTISSIPESTVDYWQLKNSDSVIQIGVVNPTGESSFIVLQDNLNSNNSQIQFGIGNFSTNNYANIDINTVGGSKNITLSVQNGTSKQILTMTPTQTTLGNETEAGDVLTTLTGVKKPSIEEVSISVSSWTDLSESSPYTYQATITLSTVISSSSTVELINNQPVLFANYGFAIANISGQTATIYSIGQPSTSVTLTVGVTG